MLSARSSHLGLRLSEPGRDAAGSPAADAAGTPALDAPEWCEHAAALLEGGVPASRLSELLPPLRVRGELAAELTRAIEIAMSAGCPLAGILRELASAARSERAAAAERAAALAAPRATGRLLLCLPLGMLLLGSTLGLNPFRVLGSSALGLLGLVTGLGLLLATWRAIHWLERRAVRSVRPASIGLDVLASLIRAGLSPEQAQTRWGSLSASELAAFERAAERARRAGCALAGTLRAAAQTERLESAATATLAARRLAVWIIVPLGLGALPAFVLLGVLPIVLAVAGTALKPG